MRIVPFDSLSDADLAHWHALRATDEAFDSPYFHPGFAAAVHASGHAVEVAVDDGFVFAFHRDGSLARPVGWPAADFQGPIGTGFPPEEFVKTAGLGGLAFDHLIEGHPGFEPYIENRRVSPYIDVSGGLDGYLSRASRSGKDNIGQARRRAKKAERELGEVRFAADAADPGLLDEVIRLKRAQYAATGARDYFADTRHVDLMHRLLKVHDTDFAGVLSTVHAGDHLLAAHFGMLSGGVLHWWFPVYEPSLSGYSPGWILLRELMGAGLERIDLGRGEDEYKRRAMTGQTLVGEGLVGGGAVRRVVRTAGKMARSSSLLRQVARGVRRYTQR
ncbi:GNAT family N-acetyltransferase [Nonomuraea sp. NPDC050663]|uniref:GNAT family N-acetyltransferase n=1 Tax=Nonomuraea sp. NPDC050663 TaxID=3364370 RepID=UPI0037BDDDBB